MLPQLEHKVVNEFQINRYKLSLGFLQRSDDQSIHYQAKFLGAHHCSLFWKANSA